MRRLTTIMIVASGLATACGGAASAGSPAHPDVCAAGQAQSVVAPSCALAQIKDLEVTIHRAQTAKDVDAFMSVWDADASLTTGGKTYTGTQEIRDFWATISPAFKPANNWIELTATPRIMASVDGDKGTLRFECYFLDIPTRVVKGISVVNSSVVQRDGRWLLKAVTIAPLTTLSAVG